MKEEHQDNIDRFRLVLEATKGSSKRDDPIQYYAFTGAFNELGYILRLLKNMIERDLLEQADELADAKETVIELQAVYDEYDHELEYVFKG